jgi:hypothetical protein
VRLMWEFSNCLVADQNTFNRIQVQVSLVA